MQIAVVGLSHKTTPIEIRDKLAFSKKQAEQALSYLKSNASLKESVLLSTCNRTEIYAVTTDPASGIQAMLDLLSKSYEFNNSELQYYLYKYLGSDVIRHLFRVASGLDSMILGEAQIAGQVREAHAVAMNVQSTGVFLNKLFMMATEVAKRVRTETDIGIGAVSVSFAAIELAKKIFGHLENRSAMLIGAGETGELTARHLVSSGTSTLIISNRNKERAQILAAEIGGRATSLDEGLERMSEVDIVITSTSAPHYILKKEDVKAAMQERKNRPIFFIDIGLPRNIEPEAGKLYNVFLYNIDDLQSVVDTNLEKRGKEAEKAEIMVNEAVESFLLWQASLDVIPTIVSLRGKFEQIRQDELERLKSKLERLSEEDRQVVATLTLSFMNKLLHEPMKKLKQEATSGNGIEYAHALRHLFSLEPGEQSEKSKEKHGKRKMENGKRKEQT